MLFFTSVCILGALGYALGECSGGCNEPTLFYEALNCKPIYASSDDCCPSKYDCADIEQKHTANEEKCYYQGKVYNSGEKIQQIEKDAIDDYCLTDCVCKRLPNEHMGFGCEWKQCSEYAAVEPKPTCHFKSELGKCCTFGEACPPFKATCKANGETYHEGNKFKPEQKCHICVCQEGFDGKVEAPFCKKFTCIDEVYRQQEVYNFCAPTYFNLDYCCPMDWICPKEDDKIVSAATSGDSNLKCKFGDKTLNIGDKFERITNERHISCECRIPPYLTCIRT